MKLCKIGFCGAGKWAQLYHIPTLEQRADRFVIKGFFDISKENACKAAGNKYQVYSCYEQLLDDSEIDFIIVASKPTATHFENVAKAIKKGKNVVVEKPMASSSAECDQLISLAKKHNVILTVHHSRRYDLDYQAALEMTKGQLGDVVYVHNNSPRAWYDNEDFSNFGTHLLDQALAMNRSPLREISAFFADPGKRYDACGYGEATLRFENPPIIRISLLPNPTRQDCENGGNVPQWNRFHIVGTKGSFSLMPISVFESVAENGTTVSLTPQTSPGELEERKYFYFDNCVPDFNSQEFREKIKYSFYDHLYKSWNEGVPLDITPEQARDTIRCLELMQESARQNRTLQADNMLETY
jgi:predicted dehydrogenase